MTRSKNYVAILAGGQGTRLWPLSLKNLPKQYLKLDGESSLLQSSVSRVDTLCKKDEIYIVTVNDQVSLVEDHVGDSIAEKGIIREPSGRNTAPCILLTLCHLLANGGSPDDVVAILSSDHVILDKKKFQADLERAFTLSSQFEKITLIGIPPGSAHTGYGYIEKGEDLEKSFYEVVDFKEKPDLATAEKYLASGKYLWNAGMFVGKIKVLLNEFEAHASDIYAFKDRLISALEKDQDISNIYEEIRKESIDYAILEASKNVAVIPASFDWSDLGSWDAVLDVLGEENFIQALESFNLDSKGNVIYAPGKFVAMVGAENMVVVEGPKGLLVMDKNRAQDVKKIITYLKENSLEDFL